MVPGQGFRFGLRRQRTFGKHVSSPKSAVISATIDVKCSVSLNSGPDRGSIEPEGESKCLKSVIHKSAITC
jgi:hypothetical protein